MKTFKALGAALGLILLAGSPGQADESRYVPWQGQAQAQAGDMPELLKNLRSLTDQAERAKAADPTFLDDLRNLANTYDKHAPVTLLFDDFRDGNFTRNPAWTVAAGTWGIDAGGGLAGLHSTVNKRSAAPVASSGQDVITNVLIALLKQQTGQGTQDSQKSQAARDAYAMISTPVAIPNPFAIRLEIASRDQAGRFDFGPYLGQYGDTSYRITYVPSAANGLVLSRVTSQGTQLLGSSNGRISLEDDRSHVIDWKRDRSGKMTVALDGKRVIEATDTKIRDSFDGFLMINSGGNYWIRSVAVTGTKS